MNDRFQGIVLFKRPHREQDALVKIFTEKFGTKMFFIKGLEKMNHTYKPQLMPITLNEYIGTINTKGLSFISEAKTLNIHKAIQSDIYKQAYSSYICQLADAAVDDNQPNQELFNVLRELLKLINDRNHNEILTIYFELFLLKYFGLHFNFNQCTICKVKQGPFDFSINKHGLLCQNHWYEDPLRLNINPKAIYIANQLSNTSLLNIRSISVSRETLNDLRRLVDEIYREFIGIRLRSKSFLDQLISYDKQYN